MAHNKSAVLGVILFTLVFYGCQGNRSDFLKGKIDAKILSIRSEGISNGYVKVFFDVEIENLLASELTLIKMRYELKNGDNIFHTANELKDMTIGPNQKQLVNIQDRFYYKRLFDGLKAEPGSKVEYTSRLWLQVKGADKRLVEITADANGILELPEAPRERAGKEPLFIDVAFVGTPPNVVDKMLELADVKRDDMLCDLGCGDGRIPIAAAERYGCKAEGYDLDPDRIREAIETVKKRNVESLVHIEQKDIFTLDLSRMDVVTMYLLPSLNVRLIPQLEKLKPGARIVSHNFPIKGVKPDKEVKIYSRYDRKDHTIYLWIAPLKADVLKISD